MTSYFSLCVGTCAIRGLKSIVGLYFALPGYYLKPEKMILTIKPPFIIDEKGIIYGYDEFVEKFGKIQRVEDAFDLHGELIVKKDCKGIYKTILTI